MIARFLKKNFQFIATFLIIGLSLPALLFPLSHFHPESKHTHSGQLQFHEHKAHFHTEVLEAYAHLIKAHPSEPELDAPLHQTHSTSDHEKDDGESHAFQKNIVPAKAKFLIKNFDFPVPFRIPQQLFSYQVAFEVLTFRPLYLFGPPSSRSPPAVLI
jgi:hypothetical protein